MKNLKIKYLGIAILFFSYNSIFGQYEPDGYIGVSLGAAFPMSDYANTDLFEAGSGFAKTGPNLNISFAYKLYNDFGIAVLLTGSSNPVNTDEIAHEASQIEIYKDKDIKISSENSKTAGLLTGAYAIFPLSHKFYFDIRLLIGPYYVYSPEYILTSTDISQLVFKDKYSVVTLGFNLGVGLKYKINTKMYLLGNYDYTSVKPEFKDVEIYDINNKKITRSIKPKIFMSNITFGLGFFLE